MSLEFITLRHAYGDTAALADITLTAAPGEITCLLGHSGCGKTTLLRLAAGLLDVQQGEIRLDGETLAARGVNPPPEARPVGLVFQEGALFPHMTVARNIAFGIERRADKDAVVGGLLQQIGLDDFANRYPHTLSGGQQQRVALARALAPGPRVLLLDEPFANVDIVLRRRLREETRRVLKARGAIAILVTHDPEEAMEIGDHIAVMEGGAIVQSGAPEELYNAPATPAVGALIGDGQIVKATQTKDGLKTAFGLWPAACLQSPASGAALELVVRAEALRLDETGGDVKIEDVRRTGLSQRVFVIAGSGERLIVETGLQQTFTVGQSAGVRPKDGTLFAFPASA